ncbi:hypothetical protein FWK35_00024857 [Aphis craccivora]|uniref:Uncharacterized protein n=1 Tax=Aphis craccivora TaxID=307492 RepID=A0A6G0YJ80_APHCR|nr:hypothetical protein FWK35_00024857 [Aphis craccivora]
MKTFSVSVLLAFVVMYVLMADTATVVEDYDDSDSNGYDEKSYDIFRYVRSANVGTEKYTKITKHPLYVFLKGLFKIITKIFSSDSVQLPDMTYENNT